MKRRPLLDVEQLFRDTAAGIQISGDSGSGKSNLMELMMQCLAKAGIGFCLIDPEGDLAANIADFCACLPERLRKRVIEIHPAGQHLVAGVNPLAVPRDGLSEFAWRARRASKVSHVTRIVISAWGEGEQGLDSRPRLAKYSSLYLNTLANCGLSIPDIRHFFDLGSRVYPTLVGRAGELMAQLELGALVDMRPRDREELIASAKNRFLFLLENSLVELMLGKVSATLDFRQLIQEGAIVIVNLERGGVLRDEDVQLLANLFLNEVCYGVFNTPESQRVPYFLFLDELPEFQSCGPQLIRVLRTARKHQLRVVSAHQGAQFFAERTEDRLLNVLVGQCGLHYYFRHINVQDARYFGEVIKLPSLNPRRVKHVLRQDQQYEAGKDLVILEDEGDNWSQGTQEGASQSHGTTNSMTDTSGTSDAVHSYVGSAAAAARQDVHATTTSQSTGQGISQETSSNSSVTSSSGGSRSRRQTLVPRLAWRNVVSSVQFMPIEEQNVEGAVELANQPIGTATQYIAGKGVRRVKLPLADSPRRRTPKFAAKKRAQLRALVGERPEFGPPEQVAQERLLFDERLVEHLLEGPCPPSRQPQPLPSPEESPPGPFDL